MSLQIQENEAGVRFSVKVVPGSSRNRIAGLLGTALKINIAAAPERGKANKELVHFLADLLAVSKSAVQVLAGSHDVRKEIQIKGINRQILQQTLEPYLV